MLRWPDRPDTLQGAALLMRVDTTSKLFGYPSIAIVCFLLAAGCAFGLLINIFMADRNVKRRVKRKAN